MIRKRQFESFFPSGQHPSFLFNFLQYGGSFSCYRVQKGDFYSLKGMSMDLSALMDLKEYRFHSTTQKKY